MGLVCNPSSGTCVQCLTSADCPIGLACGSDYTCSAVTCGSDADCDDSQFCNGVERCAPGTSGADVHGCAPGTPPCTGGQVCDEGSSSCIDTCDSDGDGVASIACGGSDCDDTDAAVHPGAAETCDGRDDDCNGTADDEPAASASCSSGICVAGSCTTAPRETQIAVGDGFACALIDDGSVYCWGLNSNGQLGNGSTDDSPVPVQVTGLDDAVQVGAGHSYACARRSSGAVACWGFSIGSTGMHSTPVAVPTITDATDLGVGARHACVARMDGTVECRGGNGEGQLGDRTLILARHSGTGDGSGSDGSFNPPEPPPPSSDDSGSPPPPDYDDPPTPRRSRTELGPLPAASGAASPAATATPATGVRRRRSGVGRSGLHRGGQNERGSLTGRSFAQRGNSGPRRRPDHLAAHGRRTMVWKRRDR